MPTLDWNRFDNLAGSQSRNFENLCRGLMRLHFGSFGNFRALKNQPGVEFDLRLARGCPPLGAPPRWWGWQCKVYERTASGELRSASKAKIVESLSKTKKHFPEITDWVLWTPYTLSRADQEWFNELTTEMQLHLWTEDEVDTYLSGPGLILRNTYFGDLVASTEELAQRHIESVQPIKEKWLEPVHQQTEAERTLRRMLGEPGSWNHLIDTGRRLRKAGETIAEFATSLDTVPAAFVQKFVHSCETLADTLLQFHGTLAEGDLEVIQRQLTERQSALDDDVKSTPRHLRRLGVPIALDATNGLHDMRTAQSLLDEVEDFFGVGLIAVLAEAGGGKSQLAAAITAPQSGRPAGVLLHGRKLHRGGDLNDLARSYTLNGKPLDGFEQLLAALDAAAKRSSCRLPLAIDGLNEAENPKNWKPALASLAETVKSYPNVLVVCTLRTGERGRVHSMWDTPPATSAREAFAVMALPEGIRRIESEGFGADTERAIRKYFQHFKIDSGDAEIPLEFLQHPLTLRIFCEVSNPERQETVSIDYFPAALAPLFKEYVERSSKRISELQNLSHSFSTEEVRVAIYKLGILLWKQQSREIDDKNYRDAVGDAAREWDNSIVNLLAQEGIIFRNPGETPGEYVLTPTYDALGGFIIASSLIANNSHDTSFVWLRESGVIDSFRGENSHELASDIFRALVALAPSEMHGVQLWKVAPEPFKTSALRFATALAPEFLDEETINALLKLFEENAEERARFYSRLYATRSAVAHPLNAEFLDKVLRPITPVGERDLSWTEWIRQTRSERFADILALEERWKTRPTDRGDSDRLRLKWLMWHLTSTDRELRDVSTRAVYWFGRGNPSALFEEAINSLEINDPYIPERMLAASYGVAMAHRAGFERESFASEELPGFARRVYSAIFSEDAPHAITHILLREYAARVIELANLHDTAQFSAEELARATAPFAMSDLSQWGLKAESEDGAGSSSGPSPLRMDFANYTLGYLVPDRGNYNFEHNGYKKTKARILWRIDQLGWFSGGFHEIDQRIASDQSWGRSANDPKKTDRYGKKYSWIAYFEMAGVLHDLGVIDRTYGCERTSDVDIDPSFPKRVLKHRLFDSDLLGSPDIATADWIASGEQPDMAPYLRVHRIGDHDGPWVALDGFVVQEDEMRKRRSFCFVRSFIVASASSETFFEKLSAQELGERWLPEKPSVIYTFEGEIPWCATYPVNGPTDFSFIENERTVKIQKTREELFLDDQPLTDSQMEFLWRKRVFKEFTADEEELTDAEMERIEVRAIPYEAEEAQCDYAEFQALIPVCDFGWEGYQTAASDAGHAVTLAREITDVLGLVNRPQEFDMFTRDGERASLNVSDHSDDHNNHQSFFFINEGLLKRYLEQTDSVLIWATWGEREYSTKHADALFHGPNRPEQTHGNIRDVHRFDLENAVNNFKEHQVVSLTKPIDEEGLSEGDTGCIVHIYSNGKVCEVEFTNTDDTKVVTLRFDQIEPT